MTSKWSTPGELAVVEPVEPARPAPGCSPPARPRPGRRARRRRRAAGRVAHPGRRVGRVVHVGDLLGRAAEEVDRRARAHAVLDRLAEVADRRQRDHPVDGGAARWPATARGGRRPSGRRGWSSWCARARPSSSPGSAVSAAVEVGRGLRPGAGPAAVLQRRDDEPLRDQRVRQRPGVGPVVLRAPEPAVHVDHQRPRPVTAPPAGVRRPGRRRARRSGARRRAARRRGSSRRVTGPARRPAVSAVGTLESPA